MGDTSVSFPEGETSATPPKQKEEAASKRDRDGGVENHQENGCTSVAISVCSEEELRQLLDELQRRGYGYQMTASERALEILISFRNRHITDEATGDAKLYVFVYNENVHSAITIDDLHRRFVIARGTETEVPEHNFYERIWAAMTDAEKHSMTTRIISSKENKQDNIGDSTYNSRDGDGKNSIGEVFACTRCGSSQARGYMASHEDKGKGILGDESTRTPRNVPQEVRIDISALVNRTEAGTVHDPLVGNENQMHRGYLTEIILGITGQSAVTLLGYFTTRSSFPPALYFVVGATAVGFISTLTATSLRDKRKKTAGILGKLGAIAAACATIVATGIYLPEGLTWISGAACLIPAAVIAFA